MKNLIIILNLALFIVSPWNWFGNDGTPVQDEPTEETETGGEWVVNINYASISQIESISGIGEALAEKIYQFISQNYITDFDQLLEVSGVGDATVEKLKLRFYV